MKHLDRNTYTAASLAIALASSTADAGDACSIHSFERHNDVSVAGLLKHADHEGVGFWSDTISVRRMSGRSFRWASGSAMQISDFDVGGGSASLTANASSEWSRSIAASTLDLDFLVDPLKTRDITRDYSSVNGCAPGSSVMSRMADELHWDYELMSSVSMDLDVEYEHQALAGTTWIDPADDQSALKIIAHPSSGASYIWDWFATHGESSEDSDGGLYRLDAGNYTLQAECKVDARKPSFMSLRNSASASLDFDMDLAENGPGSGARLQSISRSSSVRAGRWSAGESDTAVDLNAPQIAAAESRNGVAVSGIEMLDATESAAWGRHQVSARRPTVSDFGLQTAPTAEVVSEFKFTTAPGSDLVLLIDGTFAAHGRSANGSTTIEIFDELADEWSCVTHRIDSARTALLPYFGDSYQSKLITLAIPHYTAEDDMWAPITIRITTRASASANLRSEASVDCSFMAVVH